MTKYNIFFGKDFSNKGQIDSFDNLVYYDNNGSKTVKDIKNFITCFNDTICSCMLKLYKKEKGWTGSYYFKYDIENENDKKLQEISNNSEIYIIQTKKECNCIDAKQEDFYDIIIDINSIININKGWNIFMRNLKKRQEIF